MGKNPLFFSCIVLAAHSDFASHPYPEKYYQNKWCSEHHGQAEVVLADQTRADCITATHAIEFDFGKKWVESLGQALYYSLQTGKRAGIVLILESEPPIRQKKPSAVRWVPSRQRA